MAPLTKSLFNPTTTALSLHPYPSRVALRRKERQLEEELQTLLDAQEAGLVAGFSMGSSVGAGSNRNGLPTEPAWPRMTPARDYKLGLGDARTGILAAMRELAVVKDEEAAELQSKTESSKTILHQLDEWSEKKEGLEREIRDIETSQETVELQKLKQDETALQGEIHELEDRLLQLRAKQRHMASEISLMTNSVDAKLSSYKASLSLLESNIKRFLSSPPQSDLYSDEPEEIPSFLSLPARRRTLAMVYEHYNGRQEQLSKKLGRAELERDALEDGAQIWEDTLTEITAYERSLRKALRQSMSASQHGGAPRSPSLGNSSDLTNSSQNSDGLAKVASDTDRVIRGLESKLKLAEARDWRLLVCCIGAELEALVEAGGILAGLTQRPNPARGDVQQQGFARSEKPDGSEDELQRPERGSGGTSVEHANDHVGAEEKTDDDDDDDPDPDLLISHEHTD